MKYFIITKKHIKILKFMFILIILAVITVVSAKYLLKNKNVFSYVEILNEQLPTEKEQKTLSEKILGFSKDNPESIFLSYSKAFPKSYKTEEPEKTQTPQPTETPTPQKIEERTVKSAGEIKNETGYSVALADYEEKGLNLSENPTVLIVHTHTTESYAPDEGNMYFINDNSRSTDENRNMLAIGDIITKKLTECGISVIHDRTFHDYPAYNGAYGRSLKTIEKNIAENRNIEIVLDVHRDAVVSSDGTAAKMVCDINGAKTAQIMLVVGTNGGGLSHSDWESNLTFAAKIQKQADEKYSGLMRPLNLRDERFNQHLTKNSVIIEVGTNANTLGEAKQGAEYIADCIVSVIKNE